MKKAAIASVALAAALFAVSCQKENTPVQNESGPMTISAVAEGLNTPTKTEMIFKYDVAWSANDKIYVKDASGNNDTFSLSGGAGTTKGTFTQEGHASFTGEVEAYYPAIMLESGSPLWPASQTNDQTIPMYCKKTLSGAAEERMDFSSLGSVLQIVFNTTQENVALKSIEIKDGSATLSGAFTVDADGKAVITATDKAGIILNLGEGKALGKGANYFNIAVPAGNYQDLTLVFTATDGAKCTMTKGKVNIACNTVGRLTLTGETFKPDVPEGALSGEFSISATKKVQFSKGNLVATIDAAGTPTAWKFAANQYDCLGEGGANKTIGTAAGDVDLFGWPTESTTYGISTSTNYADYSGDFVDWGKNIGDGSTWRTLSNDEWVYLFKTRTNASSLYKYGVTVCGKTNCVIIAPDNWDTSANPLQTSYDATAWATAEAAGLVCLPAAGRRDGSNVSDVGDSGFYWSSTALDSNFAYFVYFFIDVAGPNSYDYRSNGFSVRLITDVAGSVPEEPVIDPLSGKFSVSASKQVQFSQGNLVATIDAAGTPTAWKFAANQYDCLGEGGANETIGTAAGDVDLFGWSTASTTYGISTSTSLGDYSGDFVDWGNNIGDGSTWRTLSKDEWVYLFETRTNASGLYEYGVTVCGKANCVIIAPDNWDTSANPLQTSYDATAWATAEAAGLVCLPAAGRRDGSTVVGVGGRGNYWSSTADGDSHVCFVLFSSVLVNPNDRDLRRYGYSVRLITESK